MKSGEGGISAERYSAPDSGALLCDMHRLILLPPHLESFLFGESEHLLESVARAPLPEAFGGVAQDSHQVLRAMGLSESEIQQQVAEVLLEMWEAKVVANTPEYKNWLQRNRTKPTLIRRLSCVKCS